jgi:hypothetical protein
LIDQLSLSKKLLLSSIWSKIRKEFTIWSVEALPGITAIGLVILVRPSGSLQLIEWVTFDSFLRLRPSGPIDKRIVKDFSFNLTNFTIIIRWDGFGPESARGVPKHTLPLSL